MYSGYYTPRNNDRPPEHKLKLVYNGCRVVSIFMLRWPIFSNFTIYTVYYCIVHTV